MACSMGMVFPANMLFDYLALLKEKCSSEQ